MSAGSVLILDDDDDLRAALGETLESIFGRPWVGAGSVDELRALEARLGACDLAILDINLGRGKPSGLDALDWLKKVGFLGRITFLTGHARSHPLVDKACLDRTARVYEKPLTLAALGRLVQGAPP
jgi:DNA-binding NtrC family response regulator